MVEMATRYIINLSEEERVGLEDLLSRKRISKLKAPARADPSQGRRQE